MKAIEQKVQEIEKLLEKYPFLLEEQAGLHMQLATLKEGGNFADLTNPLFLLIEKSSLSEGVKKGICKIIDLDALNEEDRTVLEQLIVELETFSKKTLFVRGPEKGLPSSTPLIEHSRDGIILHTVREYKLETTRKELDETYTAYLDWEFHINKSLSGAGAKLKYVGLDVSKFIEEKIKPLFKKSKTAAVAVGDTKKRKLPLKLTVSAFQVYFDFAFNTSKLTVPLKEEEDTLPFWRNKAMGFLRQTTVMKDLKGNIASSITVFSMAGTEEISFWPGLLATAKVDLLKFKQEAEKLVSGKSGIGVDLISFTFMLNQKTVDLFTALNPDFKGLLETAECNIKGSFKVAIEFDIDQFITDVLANTADEKILNKIAKEADEYVKIGDELAKEDQLFKKAKKLKRSDLIKEAKLATRKHSKALNTKAKYLGKLHSKLQKPIAKGASRRIIAKAGARICSRLVLKAIPIVNVLSTVWDVITLTKWVFDYYWSASYYTLSQSAKEEAKYKVEAAKKRKEAMLGSRLKKFVILRAYAALPNTGNGMYSSRGTSLKNLRYPIYLKFYEDSSCYRKYKDQGDLVKGKEGEEEAGADERVDFDYFEEGGMLAETEAKKYFNDDDHGALDFGRDLKDIQLHKNYLEIYKRLGLD